MGYKDKQVRENLAKVTVLGGAVGIQGPTGPRGLQGPPGSLSLLVANGSIITTSRQGTISVADAAASPSSIVVCQLQPNSDFDADDLEDYKVTATSKTGTIEFTVSNNGPVVGNFKIAYTLKG